MTIKTLRQDQENNGPLKIHKRQMTNQTYKRYCIENQNVNLLKICIKETTNQTHKKKFMAYKKIHNMYHNMLDNNYITLKVATRTHTSSHKSYDFTN
jgi:hypothetical protein